MTKTRKNAITNEKRDDLLLSYKGKVVEIFSEAEIINNTSDAVIQTGYLEERIAEAMADLGVFADFYQPKLNAIKQQKQK